MRIIDRAFYLVRLIILARLLVPKDFGLLGIAMLATLTLQHFSQTGFQDALIQTEKDTEHFLDSAWTVEIIRGVILFTILFLGAPYIASFFHASDAKPIIRFVSASFLIQAFTNIGAIYFIKNLQFNKQFIYQLSGTITDFIVAVATAYLLRSVWALVYGLMAGNLVRLTLSYILHPYRPRLKIDITKIKNLFGFGKWILGSSVVVFLLNQGGDVIVGKLLGVTALGFYQMAYRIANMPTTEISSVVSQVMFPTYSMMQSDLPRVRKAYLKVLKVISSLSFPTAALIFALASDFTDSFLGKDWMPIVSIMQILSIYGLIGTLNGSFGPLFRGVGKPHVVTIGSIAQLSLLALLIFPLTTRCGMMGAAMALLIPASFTLLYLGKKLANTLSIKKLDLLKTIFPALICSLTLFFVSALIKMAMDIGTIRFTFILISGLTTYAILMYSIDRPFIRQLLDSFSAAAARV